MRSSQSSRRPSSPSTAIQEHEKKLLDRVFKMQDERAMQHRLNFHNQNADAAFKLARDVAQAADLHELIDHCANRTWPTPSFSPSLR
jgi:hypothetical protein